MICIRYYAYHIAYLAVVMGLTVDTSARDIGRLSPTLLSC